MASILFVLESIGAMNLRSALAKADCISPNLIYLPGGTGGFGDDSISA